MLSINALGFSQNNSNNNKITFGQKHKGCKQVKKMYSSMEEAVDKLVLRSKNGEVPQKGGFKSVGASFMNQDKSVNIGKITLSISPAKSKLIENHKAKRFLNLTVRDPEDKSHKARELLTIGSKDHVEKTLDTKSLEGENLFTVIKQKVKSLAESLQYSD